MKLSIVIQEGPNTTALKMTRDVAAIETGSVKEETRMAAHRQISSPESWRHFYGCHKHARADDANQGMPS